MQVVKGGVGQRGATYTPGAAQVSKVEPTDTYLDIYPAVADDHGKMKRGEHLAHLYSTHLPHECKQEGGEQYPHLYPAHGEARGGVVVGSGECGVYPRGEVQGDMLAYPREPSDTLLAARPLPPYGPDKDTAMAPFAHDKDTAMAPFAHDKDRGMANYFVDSEARMAGYCTETDRRLGGFGTDADSREGQGGRGMADYSTDRERTMAGFTPESDSNPALDYGREAEGGTGAGGYSSERETSSQATPASRRVPVIQCLKCKEKIRERHMVLLNDGRFLHERCLRCEVCLLTIHLTDDRGSVLLRDNKVYCRKDYMQLFSAEGRREMPCCIKCNVQLEKDNWVRRADNYLFHMTCFCCSKCSRQLSKWEQFVMREERLICEKHFYENDGSQKGDSPKPRAKRMRTSFTEDQVKILQQHFAIDSNPDGQDLERIAKLTGLKKRVTQVWFQNNRARHKKSLQQKSGTGAAPPPSPPPSPPPCPPPPCTSAPARTETVSMATTWRPTAGTATTRTT